MQVLSRTERMLMIRHDEARAEVKRLRRKLQRARDVKAERRRPALRRARMAIGRLLGR